jgi:hypothetical protein
MTHNLTLTSPIWDTSTEKFGTAALNGGSGVVAGVFPANQIFTVEAWVKIGAATYPAAVAAGSQPWFWMGAETGGHAACANAALTTSYNSGVILNNDIWHHLAYVSTGDSAPLYFFVDGVLTNTGTTTSSGGNPSTDQLGVLIFGTQTAGAFPFPGEIDEIAMWSEAKYTASFTPPTSPYLGTEANLIALWHLDSNGNDSATAPPETISVTTPGAQTAGASMTVSGTYTQGPPTALDFEFDSAGYGAASSPTISGGTWSFTTTAPAAGSHTVSVRDHNNTGVSGTSGAFTSTAVETISVTMPGTQAAGVAFTLAGTYTSGPPTALDYQLDSGAWTAASSPTIGSGAFSFLVTVAAAGSHTIGVRDHNNTGVSGTSGAFSVTAQISLSPNSVAGGSAGNVITITGNGTSFSGSPFTLAGGFGAMATAQSVSTGTSGTLTINAGLPDYGNLTITDASSGATATVTVTTPSLGALKLGAVGDSITAGTNGNPFGETLTTLTSLGYTVTSSNQAISGTSTGDWAAGGSYLTNAIAAFTAAGVTIVQVMLGTNDARTPNSFSAATHHANMAGIVAALVAAGFKVIIHKPIYTVPNAGSSGAQWPNDPNSLYQQYFALDMQLVDGVNVFQGDTTGFAQAYLNPTTFLEGAGIHPANATENNLLGTYWAVAFMGKFGNASGGGGGGVGGGGGQIWFRSGFSF